MDLFAVAKLNGPDLEARLSVVRGALSAGEQASLDSFGRCVRDDGRIALNMRPSVLLSFLISAQHQNIYEWAAARAARSTKTSQQIIREQLGAFYERRVTFDGFFVQGTRFRYGALNIGGAGASYYGSYCSIIKPDAPDQKLDVAYLRADSLKTYMLPGPSVDAPAIQRDAAPHAARHCLASIKHVHEVTATAESAWPRLLCNDHDFVEAIFRGDLTTDDLECVRMAKADYEMLYEFAFEEFRVKLGKADRMEIDNFVLILEQLDRRGIRLEVV